jgi:methylase of polypeptide subunit release factors
LRYGEHPLTPFHWDIEFPEVFARPIPGFDAIVGNPPFLGGRKISIEFGDDYRVWLSTLHPNSHGNADIVAHFFRRSFELLRRNGIFGLIATKTIGQGDNSGYRRECAEVSSADASTRDRFHSDAMRPREGYFIPPAK